MSDMEFGEEDSVESGDESTRSMEKHLERMSSQLQQYTDICKDIFDNILDQNIQKHKQIEIARNFDTIKKHFSRRNEI